MVKAKTDSGEMRSGLELSQNHTALKALIALKALTAVIALRSLKALEAVISLKALTALKL